MNHGRPDKTADKGMRGRGRNPHIPGNEIPAYGSEQRAENQQLRAVEHIGIDDALAQRGGDLIAQHGPDEIEGRSHEYSRTRAENLGGNHGGNGISRVVSPVGKIEHQSHGHDKNEQKRQIRHI